MKKLKNISKFAMPCAILDCDREVWKDIFHNSHINCRFEKIIIYTIGDFICHNFIKLNLY